METKTGDIGDMHMNLSSKFIAGIAERALEKLIKKKTGMDVKLTIEQLNVAYENDKAGVWIIAAGETSKDDISKLVKMIGL